MSEFSEPVAPLPADAVVGIDPIPELVRLGDLLAQARTRAGLSTEALAQRLRVEPRVLQALEAGDHTQLPEGVFVVALARRISASLNADMEEAITGVRQSRLMAHRPPGRSIPTPDQPLSPLLRQPPGPPPAHQSRQRALSTRSPMPWWLPLAALLATCGVAAAWLLMPRPQVRPSSSPASQAPPQAPPEAAPLKAENDLSRGLAPTKTPAQASAPSESDSLRLLASEPSWVEVRDGSGRTLFQGTLSGEKRFPLGRGLEVISGRPYAVQASIGSSPPAPLGGVDDIRWKRFAPAASMPKVPASSVPSP